MIAITASAQEAGNTVTVTLDFNQNPWNYSVRQSTNKEEWGGTARTPKGTEDYWEYDGTLLDDTDFSWPMPESSGASEKIKVTLYAVDLDEYNNVSVYGNYNLDAAEAASLFVEEGYRNILYTRAGTTMRFESPEGFSFKKMTFYCYSSPNILTGDGAYDEEYEYEYGGNTFKTTRKYWTPESPKVYEGETVGVPFSYSMWEGDAKNVLFNYIFFSANFVKIEISLVPDDTQGIKEIEDGRSKRNDSVYDLQGRHVSLTKGVYIIGNKKVVK